VSYEWENTVSGLLRRCDSLFCWRRTLRGPHVVPKWSLPPRASAPASGVSITSQLIAEVGDRLVVATTFR